jgi:pimeloyl-ACP methyl ester carboxylesterase
MASMPIPKATRYPRYWLPLFLGAALLGIAPVAHAEHRLIRIGERKLSIDCDGDRSHPETVVLLAGGGRTAKDWAKVQPAISGFARVCSYDRAGLGESDKTASPQSLNEIVQDLHQLLAAAGEKTPYILVGHSIAGIYCREYAKTCPRDVNGFVFVDSSHEEQVCRLREIDPKGSMPSAAVVGFFYSQRGQKLDWKTTLPMIVLARGKPGPPMAGLTEEQNNGFRQVWRELQEDLSKRSPKGQFRVAEESGHYIHLDQPELVIQAIRDVVPIR